MKKFTKIIPIVLSVMMLAVVFAGCGTEKAASDIEYVENNGKMVIGYTIYAPMNYEENGELTGFDTEFAEAVCEKLGIKHYIADFRAEFKKSVMDYFADEYMHGRTPNPCIVCNRFLKFDAMQKFAKQLGADKIATGHYAKTEYDEKTGRYLIKVAEAGKKDQTYVLYSLTQKQLEATLMPLGEIEDKAETRKIAAELGFDIAEKAESMEICFIPDDDYRTFLANHTGKKCPEGDFVDRDGNVLGRHSGISNYTVGQRKGLGIAFGKPMFVTKIDAEKNQVVLGEKGTEFSKELFADSLNFIPFEKPDNKIEVLAKVRYGAKPSKATVFLQDEDLAKVVFEEPQRAVTPGQAVVFYDLKEEILIGGGIIRS